MIDDPMREFFPSRGSAKSIAPAQVPNTGSCGFCLINLNNDGMSPDFDEFPVRRIVVDSPPGIITASIFEENKSFDVLSFLISTSMPDSFEAFSKASI